MQKIFILFLILLACAPTLAMENYVIDYEAQTAMEKHASLMKMQAPYLELPKISGVGLGLLEFLSSRFLMRSFTNLGDIMENGRKKHIHSFGTVVAISFTAASESPHRLSGLFSSGAQFGLLRLSLAEPPTDNNWKPGIAIKLFRTNVASANIFAMPSLDGIASPNLFSVDYMTALAKPATTVTSVVITNRFEKAASKLGRSHGNIRALVFENMARFNESGEASDVNAPYSLIFRPTGEAAQLFSNWSDDFRSTLEGKGEGVVLFNVFAVMNPDDTNVVYIGEIHATSPFMASSFGDQHLYFKHEMVHDKR